MSTNPLTSARNCSPWAAGILLFTLPVLAQQYNSNDVTPPNSRSGKLTGAATGKQVGVDGNNHAILENGNAVKFGRFASLTELLQFNGDRHR